MRADTRDELWNGAARTEAVKPRMFKTESPIEDSQSNGYSNGSTLEFEDLDDDVTLELGVLNGSFNKFN